jgi:26S proteasome regulatory subunit N5
VCAYLALAAFDNEQSDMMNRVALDKKLDQVPAFKCAPSPCLSVSVCVLSKYRQMLKYFLTSELMRWPEFERQYRPLLQHFPYFARASPSLCVCLSLCVCTDECEQRARRATRHGRTCTAASPSTYALSLSLHLSLEWC